MSNNYDFTTLSPEDFERLCADLFSAEWGSQLEIFKAGKDGGIDLRHSRTLPGTDSTIIQCKRYMPHKLDELFRAMEKELPKIRKLNPNRYILATSVKLSDHNKTTLIDLLKPYIAGPQDIYGPDELNGLLGRHKSVLQSHFKLWISSTAVLERVLHARIFNVTEATVDAVKAQMCRLVVHSGFDRALRLLSEHNHCVIAGNPGIGKTTLARMLMCHYLQDGFLPIVVIGDVSDAWTIISKAAKTKSKFVILYDDFLGTLRFDENKFGKNEDTSLISFIEKARRSPNIKFVLTTREYVMADAQRIHGSFQKDADKLAKCTVLIDDYVIPVRAEVLFNHLFFSNLDEERISLFIEQKIYSEIVSHTHFNPRIIETISNQANSSSLSASEYIQFIREKFDDPSELWAHPFENQISPTAQQILVLLWSFGGSIELAHLKNAVVSFNPSQAATDVTLKFRNAMKELTGNFLTSERYGYGYGSKHATLISFQNPSVAEFIERFVASEHSWSDALASNAILHGQTEHLRSWAQAEDHRATGGAVVSVSDDFWSLLHLRSEYTETHKQGRIFLHQGKGVVYTDNDMLSNIERTLTMLQIAEKCGANDGWAKKLKERVTTIEGWSWLLKSIPNSPSECYYLARLTSWLNSAPSIAPEIYACRNTFDAALTALLNNPDICDLELSDINKLWECNDLLQISQPPQHVDFFVMLMTKIAKSIYDNESEYDRIEDAADTLKKLSAKFSFDGNLVSKLEERSDALRDERSSDDADDDSSPYNSGAPAEDFDIDAFFSSLAER